MQTLPLDMAQNMLTLGVSMVPLWDANWKKFFNEWIKLMLVDNGGRRIEKERRKFSYTTHIPERRAGKDRRSGQDRRNVPRLFSRTDLLVLLLNICSNFAYNFSATRYRIIAGRGGIGGTGICAK
jgi:hypothetical protein